MTIQETIKTIDEPKGWLKITPSDIRNLNDYCKKLESENQQLILSGVSSSTFKVAISDHYCTYDFEMLLPRTTCIRDISKRLYGSFGLKEEQGTLRK